LFHSGQANGKENAGKPGMVSGSHYNRVCGERGHVAFREKGKKWMCLPSAVFESRVWLWEKAGVNGEENMRKQGEEDQLREVAPRSWKKGSRFKKRKKEKKIRDADELIGTMERGKNQARAKRYLAMWARAEKSSFTNS